MAQFRTALLDITVSEGGTVYMEEISGSPIILSPSQIPTVMLALSQALVNRKEQELAEGREALLQSLADGANKLFNASELNDMLEAETE